MNERLFAIGDIHGCFYQFRELVEERIRIRKDDKVVLAGDFIDRGTRSKEVLDYIIELQNNGFDIIPLIGNHESMLLDALDNESHLLKWILNGGAVTLKSFGISTLRDLDQ
jgi:Calcineurin-like phosphoesterase.